MKESLNTLGDGSTAAGKAGIVNRWRIVANIVSMTACVDPKYFSHNYNETQSLYFFKFLPILQTWRACLRINKISASVKVRSK